MEANEEPCSKLQGIEEKQEYANLRHSRLSGILLRKDSGQARMTGKGDPAASYRELQVKCPNLSKRDVWGCRADSQFYKPSNFQLYEYCRTKSHKKCPFFMAGNTERRKIRNFEVLQNLTSP